MKRLDLRNHPPMISIGDDDVVAERANAVYKEAQRAQAREIELEMLVERRDAVIAQMQEAFDRANHSACVSAERIKVLEANQLALQHTRRGINGCNA